MIRQEKVADMARMEICMEHGGEKELRIRTYRRRDFVSLELIKSLILGTIAYAAFLVLFFLYQPDLIAGFDTFEAIRENAVRIAVSYAVFMAAYLVITFIYARKRYAAAHRKTADYMLRFKRVSKSYQSGKAVSK